MPVKRTRKPRPNMKKTRDQKQDKEIAKLKKKVGTPEVKYTDTAITGSSGFALTTAGVILGLNFNAQGNQPFNRQGNQIKNLAVLIRGYITLTIAELSERLVRVQLVWDKAPTGVNPTVYAATSNGTAAINDNTTSTGLIPNVFAPQSVEYRDRFKVIHDRIIRLQWGADTQSLEIPFHIYKKLNRITRFDQTAANVASLATNGLFIQFTVDNITSVAPVCNFYSRLFYTDN